jgi:hypothetical protein
VCHYRCAHESTTPSAVSPRQIDVVVASHDGDRTVDESAVIMAGQHDLANDCDLLGVPSTTSGQAGTGSMRAASPAASVSSRTEHGERTG